MYSYPLECLSMQLAQVLFPNKNFYQLNLLLDLSRAYRTIHANDEISNLSLVYWIPVNQKPEEQSMRIMRLNRITYGMSFSACALECALRHFATKNMKPQTLAFRMLTSSRYVDDRCYKIKTKKRTHRFIVV